MLSVKQGSIKYYFLSIWYDSTWDWTLIYRAIGEHYTHKTVEPNKQKKKKRTNFMSNLSLSPRNQWLVFWIEDEQYFISKIVYQIFTADIKKNCKIIFL